MLKTGKEGGLVAVDYKGWGLTEENRFAFKLCILLSQTNNRLITIDLKLSLDKNMLDTNRQSKKNT